MLNAYFNFRVIVKFSIKEKGQTKIAKAHQTFVRIFNKDGHEVIFVAELESLKIYKMEVVSLNKNLKF